MTNTLRFQLTSSSEGDTLALGAAFAPILQPADILALEGDLGAGKTRFVRGCATALAADASLIASPTYVIIHQYDLPEKSPANPRLRRIYHVDAYRLMGSDDLETLGWDRVVADPHAAILIEWPEKIAAELDQLARINPDRLALVRLQRADFDSASSADTRTVSIELPTIWQRRPGFAGFLRAILPMGAALPSGWARCPITGKPVPPESPTFPFADERARQADLGKWFSGSYQVSRELTPDDLSDPDLDKPA